MQDLTPESVVENAFAAFRRRDGSALAALATPESLEAYREAVHADVNLRSAGLTIEDMLRKHPDMPSEAAEWTLRQWRSRSDGRERELLSRFPGTAHLAELASLGSEELLRRELLAVPDEAIALGHAVVLGHVRADSEAYVLFWLGKDVERSIRFRHHPEIAALTLTEYGWRLLLDQYSPAGMPGFMNMGFVGPSVSVEPWDPSTEEA